MPELRSPQSDPSRAPAAPCAAYTVRRMQPAEAEAVATYHAECIPHGVLSELGTRVLARVYRALNASEDAFIFVGVDARGCVAGFVSGVIDVRRMYRRILRRHWLAFSVASLRHLFSIRMLRRILHTLRYPARVEGKYPQAELLSIVVAAEARGSGLATALLDALRAEFRARGVARFKVMVGAHLERANAYYRKHGFVLAGEITSHGRPSNIYVADVDAS